jgi:hypothetical protein
VTLAKKHLRLINGGLDYSCQIGATRITIVPLEAPSPEVDALVIEQDTHAVLAVDAQIVETNETVAKVTDQLAGFEPYKVGDVVVKQAQPLQLFAIVHDLDHAPSWTETWILSALNATFTIARKRQLKRLGMAALGTVHGRLPLERFIELLVETVASRSDGPGQIWVGVKRSQCQQVIATLKYHCTTHQPL